MSKLSRVKMIKTINETFPEANAKTSEEWDNEAGYIWISGTEYIDNVEELKELLIKHDWSPEYYDSGTLMAY